MWSQSISSFLLFPFSIVSERERTSCIMHLSTPSSSWENCVASHGLCGVNRKFTYSFSLSLCVSAPFTSVTLLFKQMNLKKRMSLLWNIRRRFLQWVFTREHAVHMLGVDLNSVWTTHLTASVYSVFINLDVYSIWPRQNRDPNGVSKYKSHHWGRQVGPQQSWGSGRKWWSSLVRMAEKCQSALLHVQAPQRVGIGYAVSICFV